MKNWEYIHDVVLCSLCEIWTKEQCENLITYLPSHVRELGDYWGYSDTVFRDMVSEFLTTKPLDI